MQRIEFLFLAGKGGNQPARGIGNGAKALGKFQGIHASEKTLGFAQTGKQRRFGKRNLRRTPRQLRTQKLTAQCQCHLPGAEPQRQHRNAQRKHTGIHGARVRRTGVARATRQQKALWSTGGNVLRTRFTGRDFAEKALAAQLARHELGLLAAKVQN